MIIDRVETLTQYIDTLAAEQIDLRVALWNALVLLRTSNIPLAIAEIVIEARSREYDTFDDLKIRLAEDEKKKREENPFGRLFGL